MTELINATPHEITICDSEGNIVQVLPPTGLLLRCTERRQAYGLLEGTDIETYAVSYGAVTATQDGQAVPVPEPEQYVAYVVSALVKQGACNRKDFYSPGELIRNDAGVPIGCKGLNNNY